MRNATDPTLNASSGEEVRARERLLKLLLAAEDQTARTEAVVSPRGSWHGPLPLSYAQERLWFLDQLALVGTAYNVPLALRLSGHLVTPALERATTVLVRRHEILRTRFGARGGEPYQLIDPPTRFQLRRVDLSMLRDPGERERHLRDWMHREQVHRFDLANEPALRVVLIRLSDYDHMLLWTMHHIAFDGWSTALLTRELGILYGAFVQGEQNPLPELPVQYADYAIWQRQSMQDEVLQKQLQYWKQHLRGAAPQLQLPTDRPHPAVESFQGGTRRFELPERLSDGLRELARREGATLFMVCLAAYQLLLARYCGDSDVVIGSPIAGRGRRELEGLIGLFVNTVVLRTHVSGDLTFRHLLERVRGVTLDAYANQDIPFDALVKELRPERNQTRQPIFQVMMSMQNYPEETLELPGLTWAWSGVEWVNTHFDLTLYLQDGRSRISGAFDYATDLFDARTIERMAGHFQGLLQEIVCDPDCPLQHLPLLGKDERQSLLTEWNATARAYPHEKRIHELFEEQVQRTPDADAVTCEAQSLSYRQLNDRADALARYLNTRGVGPDHLVALYFHRSIEMLVALLGVLKAGGAYVPLDPNDPAERLEHVLTDANPSILLTYETLRHTLPRTRAEVILMDTHWDAIERHPTEPVSRRVTAASSRNLAYVIYTSGSTGLPKGVMIEHRSIVNYALHVMREFDVASGSGSLIGTSMSFDLMLTGLYPTLLAARTVRLCSEQLGLAALPEELTRNQNLAPLKLTPSHLALLEEPLKNGQLAGCVRVLVLGGELLPARVVQLWRKHAPHTRIFNHYGPTEATVGCLVNEVHEPLGEVVPIGRPISNARVYVLDGQRALVPIGVTGEIYVGGVGIARGYLNRPQLTAERFVADPFSPEPGARMYKTGDLARMRSDGAIEYLGRNDHQVKIRGFRIELGEIEAQLVLHPAVKEAVVDARECSPGDKRLVGYVTPRGEGHPSGEDLRAHLKGLVPDYMIPNAFVTLDVLPLTPNGKLDRRALPQPDLDAYVIQKFEPPQGDLEATMAELWGGLLGIDRVGRKDNFFELGGHSLLGMKLVAAVNDRFSVRMSVVMVFQYPTVQELSQVLETLGWVNAPEVLRGCAETEGGVL